MAKEQKTFVAGRMNKSVDERLLPEGEYVDGQNIRLGSTELSEIGAVENTKGNVQLTTLQYKGVDLSSDAVCIGAFDDSAEETMYWFVHDPNHSYGGVVDMIVSFNTQTQQLTYHVITTELLNFNPAYLVNGVDKIDDLLFFTDDYNPPRKINVTRGYAQPDPITDVDQIIELDISVIKPQPMEAPIFILSQVSGEENYIQDSFICFAYRYKYRDGEYSALSQFTEPAFIPDIFNLDISSNLNDGMLNVKNSAEIFFETGSENVTAIDVVFKSSSSNIIYVIEKLDKSDLGYQNNSTESIIFRNGDIYTILSEGEILRLYDNVPRLAKAQTIMGGRLMYGNYLEGRDLIDENGNKVFIDYDVSIVSEEAKFSELNVQLPYSSYEYYFQGVPPFTSVIPEAMVHIDTTSIDPLLLKSGAIISFKVTVDPYPISGSDYIVPNGLLEGSSFVIQFTHTLDQNYTSVFDALNSQAWKSQVGALGNYQENPSQWNQGSSFTDVFNSATATPTSQGQQPPIEPYRSGRGDSTITCYESDTPNTSAVYLGADTPDRITFIPNAIQYQEVNDTSKNQYYQYFKIIRAEATFFSEGISKSLHSNRDYQVGIVYQDKEGRQTTALTSLNSTIHVPAQNSDSTNSAKVTIPQGMLPPSWADRYKFVMKPSQSEYETIFATIFYVDQQSADVWIKLEGEQKNKVSVGQELIVKSDSNGALDSLVTTTILDLVSQESDFLPSNETQGGDPISESAGLYAKVKASGWAANYSEYSILTNGTQTATSADNGGSGNPCPPLNYPLYTTIYDYTTNPPTPISYEPWEVTTGSVVNIKIKWKRKGRSGTLGCVDQKCVLNRRIVATQNYNNLKDFWDNEYIDVTLSDCSGNESSQTGDGEGVEPECNIYNQDLYDLSSGQPDWIEEPNQYPPIGGIPNGPYASCYESVTGILPTGNAVPKGYLYQFRSYSSGPNQGQFFLGLSKKSRGTQELSSCGFWKVSDSIIECEISISSAETLLTFETIPSKTSGEIYYENEQSFPIVNGFHTSGNIDDDQNQTATDPAIVNLTFFNCFQFSNGVESYKIKDSITGDKFYLGNRVTSVSEQDYKEIRREASITYSGVYNEQTNINRTNEFNLGLANYKDCEISYGPIQVLHGRRTDLLTLQEDRISYISLGKNLLTAADGVGVLTSVPEVLGIQVARIEEYGISENPESFCHYGADIYFTDAKRSAVIQLKGGSQTESLSIISDAGMRSWFRDLFQTSFDYQKLGGYDPYMDEYVLSPNTNLIPSEPVVYGCGGASRVYTGLLSAQRLTIDAGLLYGNVTVFVVATHAVEITVTYNGVTTPPVSGTGSLNLYFDKDVPSVTTFEVTITPTDPNSLSSTEIFVGCPVADTIKIVPIAITSASDQGDLIHNAYGYSDATVTPTYQSPYQSSQVLFESTNQQQYISPNIVSQFGPSYTGTQGSGSIPINGSTVQIISSKIFGDTFDFDTTTNGFRYLRTATEYQNNAADIATLLSSSTATSNLGSAPLFYGEFSMPSGNDDDFLYLIWDYREFSELKLCYSTDVSEVCCECFSSPSCVPFLGTTVELTDGAACALTPTTTYYTSTITSGGVTNTQPIVGTTVYSYLGCSSGNTVGAGFIKLTDNTWVETDSNGEVTLVGSC